MRESECPSEEELRIERWRRLIFRQQSSPVPVTQFCGQMGINTRKFYYWKRLRDHDAASSRSQITPSGSMVSRAWFGNLPAGLVGKAIEKAVEHVAKQHCLKPHRYLYFSGSLK
jgi:hypothetical protein